MVVRQSKGGGHREPSDNSDNAAQVCSSQLRLVRVRPGPVRLRQAPWSPAGSSAKKSFSKPNFSPGRPCREQRRGATGNRNIGRRDHAGRSRQPERHRPRRHRSIGGETARLQLRPGPRVPTPGTVAHPGPTAPDLPATAVVLPPAKPAGRQEKPPFAHARNYGRPQLSNITGRRPLPPKRRKRRKKHCFLSKKTHI